MRASGAYGSGGQERPGPPAQRGFPDLEELKTLLGLRPLPHEGGFFAETYRSDEALAPDALPGRREGRALASAIYYLITREHPSTLHRLRADEIFHFYLGDPAEMLQLRPDGSARILTLGTDLVSGMRPQALVPRECWQGTLLLPGGRYALLGTTMAPGFEPSDFEAGDADALIRAYPGHRERILALSPRRP